ncbi:MAG: hypothetical protein IJC13_06980 [Clostridia bacterium]|nr:hypothetical protein [Clostridia bacterium]
MKLAKKVLSVVLALAIALGAFAVAASANGSPDADYQVKMWLTGSVGTATWATASRVTIDEGDESEPGATIEVQPGDTVFVRVYVTNNYMVHTIQANLFYSKDLIDAAEEFTAQKSATIKPAALKKIHLWNEDNYWVGLQGNSYSAQNAWSLQDPTFNADVAQNWPTDDAGNNLFKIDEWKFNRFNNLVTSGVGETCMFDDPDNSIIMMPVKVPANAAPGSTYYVTIPEGLEQRSTKTQGALRLYENGVCADCGEGGEPCELVDSQAALNPNMKYSDDNQYWDLSEATLTLQIPGASEPEVNYDELNAKLTEAANLLAAGNLTADSIATLNAAITAGNSALTAEDQETVNTAVETLTAAIAAAKNLANFEALNAALAEYATLNAEDWTDTSWADVAAAYATAAAIDQTNEADQDKVDAAANDLATAIDNLVPALVYTALEAKYNEVKDTDTSIYTDATAGAFNSALAVAKNLVENKNAADQNEIDTALNDLTTTFGALAEKDANYEALTAAKDRFTALNAKEWTVASYNAAKDAYDAACEVPADLKISQQATIDNAANELNAKIDALVPAGAASYTALDEAIAAAKALVADHYVDFSGVTAALATAENVDRNLTSNDQAIVDEATNALVAAMGALVPADADYSAVELAKTAAAAKVAENDEGTLRYTDASIDAINDAVAAVVEGLKKADQETVDGYAAAINAAIEAAEYRPYDYSAIEEKIALFETYNRDDYKYDTYDAVAAAIEALVWGYTHEQYGLAKVQENKFNTTWNALALADAANYDDVNLAIDEYEAKIAAADYEQDGIDAVDAIIEAIDWQLNENKQDVVDGYAAAIREATDALVEVVYELVDYTRLDAAIKAAKEVNADLYTGASYNEVTTALYTAESISRDLLKEEQQDFVDEVAKTLEDAIAALELKANYADLDAAILRAGTYDKNVWTDTTWAVVEEKLAAANDVDRELGETQQDIIDEAAAALNKALDDLVAKEVVSSISTINWTPSEDTHNTFTVAVTGRMAMIQFIEMDGGTRTYDRYNKNVKIVSYNAAGEEVNSLSRDVAYEVWTIDTNLIGPDVKARAKYLEGNSYKWETETYDFTVETLEPVIDADVRSITPAATAGKKGAVATTVVVGPDAQGIRFVMSNDTTTTYYADKATVLDNGDLQFVGNAWANDAGLNTIIVKVRVNNVWVEAGTVEYTVE